MTKLPLLVAAGAMSLTAAAFASTAQAGEVEIRDAVARVVVIPENRSDIQVSIEQGGAGLPALTVRRRGDDVIVDGDLRRRIGSCQSGSFVANPTEMPNDVSVEVRGHGRIDMAQAPLIVVRTPMNVEVNANGAVWGSVGRSSSVELGAAGCGDWSVANTEGSMSLNIGGSGDIRAGTARDLDANIGGSGDIRTGAVGAAEANIGGSGNIEIAAVNGAFSAAIGGSGDIRAGSVNGVLDTAIGGSGDIRVDSGRAPSMDASIAGSGSIVFEGEAGDLDATIVGGGDIVVARVTGRVDRTIIGGGEIRVGD